MSDWLTIQESIRTCSDCQCAENGIFAPFNGAWPTLPEPRSKAVLFISEAPPRNGGFWTIQPCGRKQDDLREKLFRLLNLSPADSDCGLKSFCDSGYYLLQAFPRPLGRNISNIGRKCLKYLLCHQVKTHLREQIDLIQPSAVLALGVPAATAVSMLWPNSEFARCLEKEKGKLKNVRGETFEEDHSMLLSATYLPSGQGQRRGKLWGKLWEEDIPGFIKKVRPSS